MIRLRQWEQASACAKAGAVTIGNFDGVHRGHARIIQRLREQARAVGGPAVVFTFNPPPAALLRPDQQPAPLTWLDRKARLLAELGVDVLVEYPTNFELLGLTAQEFFERVIVEQLAARGMVEGPNFYFGRGRTGDVRQLAQWCAERRMKFEVVPPLRDDQEMLSSSRVRQAVQNGDLAAVRQMLTRPYRVRGAVVRGAARGAKIGFPTANLSGLDTLLPAPGVYAGRAIWRGKVRSAAIHLGPIPTFDIAQSVLEVHLLDYAGDLYGERMEVELLARIRDVQRFSGIETLQQQLQRDVAAARQLVDQEPSIESDEQWIEVRVGRRQGRKGELLRAFADQLLFPSYFHENWDSWEECLRDLSWLPAGTGVRVIHDGEPLDEESARDRTVYREVLTACHGPRFLIE
ncbi:MAG: bifunctional riboflavin kinase/FAD synthetase [Pirellulales bacterium]